MKRINIKMNLYVRISEVLYFLNGITDQEFADMINVAIGKINSVKRSTVTNWKNGGQKPKQERWEYIAQVIGISVSELVSDDGYIKSTKIKQELEETKALLEEIQKENGQLRNRVSGSKLDEIELNYLKRRLEFYKKYNGTDNLKTSGIICDLNRPII